MRYDLAFFICCCKSFLGDDVNQDNFYSLLGVESDAGNEEIKKAYKKKSLQMHPDKLAQRGQTVTAELQAEFTRMKEAYEVLSDPRKREAYDAIGERGMKWMEEPFSMDPQELAHNFAKSSILDRSKIFGILVGVAVAVLILPICICLNLDGTFGDNASWFATLIPLWFWDAFIIFYNVRVIMMGPFERPDHVPTEEWVDPLPMEKRYMSLFKVSLITIFEVLAALKLDDSIDANWSAVFIPLYLYEATTFYKKWPIFKMRIVATSDLEEALGKPFAQFTDQEKDLIEKRYSIVPSLDSEQFDVAQKLKANARRDLITSAIRIIFIIFLIIQLDGPITMSWWLVFLPVWIMSALICIGNVQAFSQVQQMVAEKDPTLFGLQQPGEEATNATSTDYGAVGVDGAATSADASASPTTPQLTEEEREDLKAFVTVSASNLVSKCCSQGFILILVCMFVAKLQGASFSSLWIISPFLLSAGIILMCMGLAIFGISEQPEGDEFHYEANHGFGEESPLQDPSSNSHPSVAVPMGMSYAPPSTTAQPQSTEVDPEQGEQAEETEGVPQNMEQTTSTQAPFDHLDDASDVNVAAESKPNDISIDTNIHELD